MRIINGRFPQPQPLSTVALCWQAMGGPYLQTAVLPKQTAVLSQDRRFALIPYDYGAAVMELGEEHNITQYIPVKGALQAAFLSDEQLYIMSSSGELIADSPQRLKNPFDFIRYMFKNTFFRS